MLARGLHPLLLDLVTYTIVLFVVCCWGGWSLWGGYDGWLDGLNDLTRLLASFFFGFL